ncbi:MAG TPA: TolC family outer membrane protein [Xanthomonadaceae bacterium]|nr:TolC family outer membrane protein [Xanthomonadaceae bacterium]
MRFMSRPLAFALALALAPAAGASDLMDAYELARQSDPTLAGAEARRGAQGETVVQSRSVLLPQINGEVSLTDQDIDATRVGETPQSDGSVTFGPVTSNSDTRTRSYNVTLRQSIYDHSNYTRLRASKDRSSQSGADLDAAVDQLMLRVAEAYFGVLTAIDSVVFARGEKHAVGRQLDQADQRFEVGLTAITDVHEARARFDSARATEIAALNALDDAREALAEITGHWMEALAGLSDEFEPSLPEPTDLAAWVDAALANNPLIHSRELALRATGHDIATARAGHLPSLGGFASYGDNATWGDFNANNISFPANSISDGPTVGLTLTVPIFSGFATQSRVRQNILLRDAAEQDLEAQERAIVRQTRSFYRSLITGISEIEARRQGQVSAQSALEATEAGFEVGTRTIVDVLLSQQLLFQAQRDYSTARHNFLVNTLRLKQAAGVIQASDLEQVNRLLTEDAEARLQTGDEDADSDPDGSDRG